VLLIAAAAAAAAVPYAMYLSPHCLQALEIVTVTQVLPKCHMLTLIVAGLVHLLPLNNKVLWCIGFCMQCVMSVSPSGVAATKRNNQMQYRMEP
jgi:hypothetical protein